jgi:AcrR family transcriptional regulator
MNRREASKKETRDLILQAARQQFLEQGVEKTTMRSIAKAAGVSPASVVVHFRNKTALLEQALFEDIDRTLARARTTLDTSAALQERTLHIARTMMALYDSDRDLYRSLLRHTLFEPPDRNPALTRQMDEHFDFLAAMVEREQRKGRMRKEIDPVIAAFSMSALYFGTIIMLLRTPEMPPSVAENLLADMTEQLMQGLREPRNGSEAPAGDG